MKCKNNYRDMDKYYAAKRRQQERHRRKYGAHQEPKEWTDEEMNLILTHDGNLRELIPVLERSLNAIYSKRHKILKGD